LIVTTLSQVNQVQITDTTLYFNNVVVNTDINASEVFFFSFCFMLTNVFDQC